MLLFKIFVNIFFDKNAFQIYSETMRKLCVRENSNQGMI